MKPGLLQRNLGCYSETWVTTVKPGSDNHCNLLITRISGTDNFTKYTEYNDYTHNANQQLQFLVQAHPYLRDFDFSSHTNSIRSSRSLTLPVHVLSYSKLTPAHCTLPVEHSLSSVLYLSIIIKEIHNSCYRNVCFPLRRTVLNVQMFRA